MSVLNINNTDILNFIPITYNNNITYMTMDKCLEYNKSVLKDNMIMNFIVLGLIFILFLYFIDLKSIILRLRKKK